MEKEAFKSFIESKANDSRKIGEIDWSVRQKEWLSQLRGFYSQIDRYLADFLSAGQIKMETSSVFIKEDYIGEYQAESRRLFVGADKVNLVPIGTLLVGARGRVDMIGPAGTVKFILTGKHTNGVRINVTVQGESTSSGSAIQSEMEEEYVWKIATPLPKVRFIELTPENFFGALTEVLNG